jgi:membrane-associated protease RseP (regulator of RpoE activity)
VGDPEAVRNPLFEYAQKQDLAEIDRTPGPRTVNYPAECVVEDCLIHGIGRVERQPAGVQISMSHKITVRDTSIYDCARAGINIGDGCWGGHLIERCDVFDTVLETHDHGSFNSWGRDRYWMSNHRGLSEPEVKKDPRLPFLDVIDPITIRDSRWRCDHGWDIDLDDGSSNYVIYNNLMLAGGLKFREGYGRKAYNNIMVNNGFHPHVWFDKSDSGFRHNIVMKAHAPIGQPVGWGGLVDENLFAAEADRVKHLDSGGDSRSLAADPMFIDPAAGDFRVKDGSPAFKIGFKNFAMDQFGVKKPALKALAKSPVIPPLKTPAAALETPDKEPRLFWLGAPLHSLTGEEFSAFGVSREDMGVQLVDVPAASAAATAGLKTNDLIQSVNGAKVAHAGGLFAALTKAGSGQLKLRVIRNQQPVELTIQPAHHILVEAAADPASFRRVAVPPARELKVAANQPCANDPLSILTDGKLEESYGPVFGNGVRDGAYRIDLGAKVPVVAVNTWSFNQNGNRGHQRFTVHGSASATDPGWDTKDAARFIPLGSVDTRDLANSAFTASSLRAAAGGKLGDFRWIVIESHPVTGLHENTSWQEFHVELRQ